MSLHSAFKSHRLIYQNTTPSESYLAKEAKALQGVEGTVTDSVKARIELKHDIEGTIGDIRAEQQAHRAVLDKLKLRLIQEKPATPIAEQFESAGQIIQTVMDPSGGYQDYINGQPISFLAWAISQKKNN